MNDLFCLASIEENNNFVSGVRMVLEKTNNYISVITSFMSTDFNQYLMYARD